MCGYAVNAWWGMAIKQQPADALPAFRDFVTNEKVRLTQKRQTIMKNERDKRMADLLKFSQSFKVRRCHYSLRDVHGHAC